MFESCGHFTHSNSTYARMMRTLDINSNGRSASLIIYSGILTFIMLRKISLLMMRGKIMEPQLCRFILIDYRKNAILKFFELFLEFVQRLSECVDLSFSHGRHSFIVIGIITAVSCILGESNFNFLIHHLTLIHCFIHFRLHSLDAVIKITKVMLHLVNVQ
jgi:hypothetical protein